MISGPDRIRRCARSTPAIWDDFDDFTGKADLLQAAARNLDIVRLDALRAGTGAVGQACAVCHKVDRLQK
ncbi:cytochrome c [Pseudooceanicola sp.]|uniref:cytochrome c n=1 Tax=Pseudooceanicola sp. TaxID=1914328 RepID=UPI002611FBCB|nr:cytochrome c [Pseudooceanicola sp.]MDF1856684.1 cytochrome c [Pseudooceanicola sp.]